VNLSTSNRSARALPPEASTFDADFFALLGLPRQQTVDASGAALLDARYREIQGQVHPDKHAHASAADQRLAMQWATRVNEAYRTLKAPLARATYLLGLLGHDVALESNTAMPADFLMMQMEWREALDDAKAHFSKVSSGETALDALETLANTLRAQMRADQAQLAVAIDQNKDYAAAALFVRQLMFHEKLLHDIDDAIESVTE
jgi:molecular chaperone HscB